MRYFHVKFYVKFLQYIPVHDILIKCRGKLGLPEVYTNQKEGKQWDFLANYLAHIVKKK